MQRKEAGRASVSMVWQAVVGIRSFAHDSAGHPDRQQSVGVGAVIEMEVAGGEDVRVRRANCKTGDCHWAGDRRVDRVVGSGAVLLKNTLNAQGSGRKAASSSQGIAICHAEGRSGGFEDFHNATLEARLAGDLTSPCLYQNELRLHNLPKKLKGRKGEQL